MPCWFPPEHPGGQEGDGGQVTLNPVFIGGQVRSQDNDEWEPRAHHPGAMGGCCGPADRQQREDGYRHHAGEGHHPGPGTMTARPRSPTLLCPTLLPKTLPSPTPAGLFPAPVPRGAAGSDPWASFAAGRKEPDGVYRMQGDVPLRRVVVAPAPVEAQRASIPQPLSPSPSVTPIYYGQDLPIKFFSNPLPSPALLRVRSSQISPELPRAGLCQPLWGSIRDIKGPATGHTRVPQGCWLLEKTPHGHR